MAKKGFIPWNKGLTKETDERVKVIQDKINETYFPDGKNLKSPKTIHSKNPEDWILIYSCGCEVKCKTLSTYVNNKKLLESGGTRNCMSCVQIGKEVSDEFREKMRSQTRTEEQRKANGDRTRERYANMTPEEKEEVSRIQSAAFAKGRANMSEDRKAEIQRNKEEALRNMSPERKAEKNRKISEANKKPDSLSNNPETWRLPCSDCETEIIFEKYHRFQNAKSGVKKGHKKLCEECKVEKKRQEKLLGLHRKNKWRNQFDSKQWQPKYNKNTIPYIVDILNVRYDTEFRHAESEGGEFRIYDDKIYTHYFADAYCSELNIWIEFDEPHHFSKGELREECRIREERIRSLIPNVMINRIFFDKRNHN